MEFLETDSMRLVVALMVGLLLGAERGWSHRETRDGGRMAGLRTFGIIGLLGGICGLLSVRLGAAVFGLTFFAVAVVLLAAHVVESREDSDHGMTSVAAALLVFALGGLSAIGEPGLAAAAAVVATLILSYKTLLHGWLDRLQRVELRAVLKLLLISVVMLPLLPDRGSACLRHHVSTRVAGSLGAESGIAETACGSGVGHDSDRLPADLALLAPHTQ